MAGAGSLYRLIFTVEFEKNFDKLKDKTVQRRILKKVMDLKEEPEQGKMLVGLQDDKYGHFYRIRIGKHRVVYAINHETDEVYLITVGPRENIYDRM
jgi:mRNA-degrading endonuclease RelE of RelBE toxin-antitoxin system